MLIAVHNNISCWCIRCAS